MTHLEGRDFDMMSCSIPIQSSMHAWCAQHARCSWLFLLLPQYHINYAFHKAKKFILLTPMEMSSRYWRPRFALIQRRLASRIRRSHASSGVALLPKLAPSLPCEWSPNKLWPMYDATVSGFIISYRPSEADIAKNCHWCKLWEFTRTTEVEFTTT